MVEPLGVNFTNIHLGVGLLSSIYTAETHSSGVFTIQGFKCIEVYSVL